MWWVNGISVGATSVDVLKHLSASLICKANGSDRVDRITRLVQQVTRQQSFYPLVPPAHGVNLDSSHISNTYFHTFTPHLLLFTSDIKYFVKVHGSDTCNAIEMATDQRRHCICIRTSMAPCASM